MISKTVEIFCREDISKIKNYAEAMADTTQVWECHHWNEQWFTRQELLKLGRYWNVPADELVFMTRKEHSQWHSKYGAERKEKSKKCSEVKKGENNPNYGKICSEETRKKLSEAHKGKHHSSECRKKNSESQQEAVRAWKEIKSTYQGTWNQFHKEYAAMRKE